MFKDLLKGLGQQLSIAFETNGKGYIGYIVELPGGFVRGQSKKEALTKVGKEANLYLKWLGAKDQKDFTIEVAQVHNSSLTVEDADNEILLEADKKKMDEDEFQILKDLVLYSGDTFFKTYQDAKLKDWVDQKRVRKTFYGDNPASIQAIYAHVKNCQYYYLSRLIKDFEEKEDEFKKIRLFCLEQLQDFFNRYNNSIIQNVDNELWTLKKVLRRFVWHDRIHAKAMIRILQKQKDLDLIKDFSDPFFFQIQK